MSLRTVNDMQLWVQDTGASSGKGTVLLLHGFPDTSAMWAPQVAALSGAGYRVIAPDLPGLGNSPGPQQLAQYSLASSVAPAMLALLDALGVPKAAVVGHDFGAALAWTMAVLAPARVERMAVLSVGYPGTYYSFDPVRQQQASWYIPFNNTPGAEEAWMACDWGLFRAAFGLNASQQQLEGYISRLGQPGALSSALSLYRANYSAASFANLAGTKPPAPLPMPVLGVHGADDAYCLAGQMEGSRHAVAPGAWHYRSLAGVGHWIPLQRPDATSRLLLDFLEGRMAATGAARM